MISSSCKFLLVIVLLAVSIANAWAGLGESEGSIVGDRMRMRAFHSVMRAPQYSVHELTLTNGTRMRQYVSGAGQVFAVSWIAMRKPELSILLGNSFNSYASAAKDAASQSGTRREFRQDGADLVVQSSGRLQVFRGFAYRPSMMPKNLSPQSIGLG
jgi:hypothetical protein